MAAQPGIISDRLLYAFAHPLQRRRFYLALVFSIILFPVIAVGLILGTMVLIVPVVAFFLWLGARVMFTRLLANSILVSSVNYPRINALAEELKAKMGYEKPIYIFVYEQGNFNAYMRYLFFRRAIFLNSELLETGVSDDEVRWIVGRFIGYLRTRQQAGVLGWVIRAAQHLLVFNVFLLPYERAMVFTGDRLAVAAINGDISSAVSAMQKLLVGRQLGYSVNPEGIVEQQRRIKGTFFAFLARLMSGFPHMTTRYVDLIVFAKAYFPLQFAQFEAANPGLPADLSQLAASPESGIAPPPERLEAAAKPPQGWAWATATAAVTAVAILGIGYPAWHNYQQDRYDSLEPASLPAPDTPGAPSQDAPGAASDTSMPPAEAPDPPSSSDAQPNVPPIDEAPDPSTGLPPHVHRTATGQLAPDTGCSWVTSDANDFRVTCN
ncbi:MAG TPA: hypothetical protein VMR17_04575 [Xanthobacteraceae bacterium]|nr:hypothetical protein [Xanthobacteraceae bacterium]